MERAITLPVRTRPYTPPVIVATGAIVGRVVRLREHPRAERIWLATVDLGQALPVQIVFGGKYKVRPGELVPVAPPGALVMAVAPGGLAISRTKKMRCRRYRGERSHGMLCSLAELGWVTGGPDEVAILRHVSPGDRLDDLPAERQAEIMTRPARPITVVDVMRQSDPTMTHEADRSAAKD